MPAQIDMDYIRRRPTRLWSRLLSYAFYEGRPLTTRGRWLNHAVFANYAIARSLPQLAQVKAPVFILGTGRSGTTVLGIVLSMHRDIGFLNEPKAAWHAAHGAEDLIGSYTRGAASYRLDESDADQEVIRRMQRYYGAYSRLTLTRRVVDKYPELIFRVPFVKAIFPDAKFLFLARNGWDTCVSIQNWSRRLGTEDDGETQDWWGADGRKWQLLVDQLVPEHPDLAPHIDDIRTWSDHTHMAALEWVLTMREGLALMAGNDGALLHVPYEELCADPSDWMARICDFAGYAQDPVFMDYSASKLSPVRPVEPVELPACLTRPFHQTMSQLGYQTPVAA